MLYTLGELRLTGDLVTRPKLLLLLAYLALEGAQNRRQLALLFWGSTQNPMVSLRLALSELRKVPDLIEANRNQVSTSLKTDVADFEAALREGDLPKALELYHGPFLDNLSLGLEEDLENWLIETRERLAQKAVALLLGLAEQALESGDLALAAKKAEEAYLLKAAPYPYGQALSRLHQLLRSSQSPLADKLERDYGDELFTTGTSPDITTIKPNKRTENPYRGLLAFREVDASYFFGREAEIALLLEQVTSPPYSLCIVGNSGAGKSSLVFAGLLPRLREQGWLIATLRPGRYPFSALALSLLELSTEKPEAELLDEVTVLAGQLQNGTLNLNESLQRLSLEKARVALYVDQSEELFSLNDTETVARFLTILQGSSPELVTMFTLRADYLPVLLSYPASLSLIREAQYLLGPIQGEALAKVITEPAKKQGASFEPGLTERILNDLTGQKNSLPLLAFTLMQLWERQEGNLLKHDSYEAIGGIAQALVRHAEESFAKLSLEEQQQAELVFLQLVNPGQGQADSKRVAYAHELKEHWSTVINKLASYPERLLVIGLDEQGETVELIHEALIDNWARLKNWINTYRGFRSWQERFRQYLRLWERQEQNQDLLLQGYLLQEAEQYRHERPDFLSGQEKSFIDKSLEKRALELEQEDQQRKAQLNTLEQLAEQERTLRQADTNRIQTQRVFIRWLGGLGFLAVFFSLFALSARNNAVTTTHRLSEQQAQNQNLLAELLSEKAAVNQANLPEQSILLSLEANSRASTSRTQRITEAVLRQVVAETVGIRLAHPDRVLAACFSPNQDFFATAGRGNAIRIWSLKNVLASSDPKPVSTTETPGGDISALSFSNNGQWLLSTSFDGSLSLWDASKLPELSLIQSFKESDQALLAVQFSPDSQSFVAASRDHVLRLWHLKDNWTLESKSPDLGAPVQSVRFSPDGSYLAAGTNSEKGQVFLWQSYDLSQAANQLELANGVRSLAFSPDLKYLAIGDQEGKITLINPQSPNLPPLVLAAHDEMVVGLSFSPERTWLASSSRDQTVKLWFLDDLASQDLPRHLTLHAHEDKLGEGLDFSPDGQYLLSTGWDNAARLISMAYPGPDLSVLPLNSPARSIAFNQAADRLALGNLEGEVQVYTPHNLSLAPQVLGKHDSWVEHIGFSLDGQQLVSTGDASKGEANTVLIWKLGSESLSATHIQSQQGTVFSAAFGLDNTVLATAGENQSIALWDLRKPGAPLILGPFEDIVTDLIFSPDKHFLASSSFDKTLRLFDTSKAYANQTLDWGEPLRAVALSPDGHYLAAASWQGGAFLQDLEQLDKPALKIPGETGSSYAIAFSPDSDWLAIGNDNASITLTRTQTPLETLTLRGHSDVVWSLSFSPDKQWLVSASADGSLRYWYLSFDRVKELACKKAGRNLSQEEWQKVFGTEPYKANCSFTTPQASR